MTSSFLHTLLWKRCSSPASHYYGCARRCWHNIPAMISCPSLQYVSPSRSIPSHTNILFTSSPMWGQLNLTFTTSIASASVQATGSSLLIYTLSPMLRRVYTNNIRLGPISTMAKGCVFSNFRNNGLTADLTDNKATYLDWFSTVWQPQCLRFQSSQQLVLRPTTLVYLKSRLRRSSGYWLWNHPDK